MECSKLCLTVLSNFYYKVECFSSHKSIDGKSSIGNMLLALLVIVIPLMVGYVCVAEDKSLFFSTISKAGSHSLDFPSCGPIQCTSTTSRAT